MSYVDDDLFDEPAEAGEPEPTGRTREARGLRGRGRGPSRGGGGGSPLQQPRIRLLIAVGLLVVVALILVSTIRGCQRDKLVDSYRGYIAAANQIADESTAQGKALQKLLDNKSFQRPVQIVPQVDALAKQAQALVERARGLNSPDRLGAPNRTLVTALEYRALGLGQLPTAIDAAVTAKDRGVARTTLASPLQVLGASDVIYRTSYVGPAEDAIQRDRIKDVRIARSEFFPGNLYDRTSLRGAADVIAKLKRVRQSGTSDSGTAGSRHGLQLATTFAVRGADRRQLTPGATVSLIQSADLKFEVTVDNGGDFQENNIDVKFTYSSPDNPQGTSTTKTIDQIDPGEANQRMLEFELPGGNGYLSAGSTIRVEVAPVPDERVTGNNSAEYPVEFNLQ